METENKPKVTRVGPLGTLIIVLIFLGLIALNVYQSQVIADLRVKVEQIKVSTFLRTQEMVIDKYWAEQKTEWACIVGDEMLQTNEALLEALDQVTK